MEEKAHRRFGFQKTKSFREWMVKKEKKIVFKGIGKNMIKNADHATGDE